MILSAQSRTALAQAVRLCERDYALLALVDALDPDRTRSVWSLAGQISARLQRFESGGYRRIAAGHREPQGALEAALMACCGGCCPQSQRKLLPILQDLLN